MSRIKEMAADLLQTANVKRLVDYDVSYRLRVGNYRILFERDDMIRITDKEKLADYLDYLHIQAVKKADPRRFTLEEVEAELGL
jgi:hypothetical protein